MKKQQTADRLLSLDIPRIVAVFLVLCRHAHWPVKNAFLDMLHCGGWVGVELFLVLSSFLVGDLLLRDQEKRGTINWARFYVRRGLKIYPAFWCLLAYESPTCCWQRRRCDGESCRQWPRPGPR